MTRKILAVLASLELLIIVVLSVALYSRNGILGEQLVRAQDEESINQDVVACRSAPFSERQGCAEKIGVKVATLFATSDERVRECSKLRPLLFRFCQQGLTLVPSPTPTLTPTLSPSPESSPSSTPESPTPTPEITSEPTATPQPSATSSPTPTP